MRTRFIFVLTWLGMMACGGDQEAPPPPPPDAPPAADLTCASFALCTSHQVFNYAATVNENAATGGTITDGVYVLAWSEEAPRDKAPHDTYEDYVEALVVSGNQWLIADSFSYRGTFAVASNQLTLSRTHSCTLGSEDGATTGESRYLFSAADGRIDLYTEVTSGDETWYKKRVYLNASASAACATVGDAPSSPGPSASCTVRNCYCLYAVGDELDGSACE